MKEERVYQISELKGRRTTMEIIKCRCGDQTFRREIVHRPDASAAIVETEDGRFVLVKQHRTAVGCEMIEAVAGVVDDGENPLVAIIREIKEETGHDAVGDLIHNNGSICYLGKIRPSPGYTDETVHLYYIEVSNVAGEQRPDDDERVEYLYVSYDEMNDMIHDGRITDAKTIVAWYHYNQQIR